MINDCLFCKIVEGSIPAMKVYEDGDIIAFMDIQPVNPGHVLVIPKEHHPTLAETPSKIAGTMMQVVPELMQAVMKATGAPAANIAVNNGEVAGQVIFHTHLHIMPRFEGDGYDVWHGKPYENDEEAAELANKIRESL